MHTIHVRNVHRALPNGLEYLHREGYRSPSRAGDVLVSPTPVTTVYDQPCERVLFWPDRNANPVFHLLEALWMLGGRNDVEWLAQFNSRMKTFSDDGKTFHGAYGYRWRKHFFSNEINYTESTEPLDQLDRVVQLLRNNPKTRRAVIQMWDCEVDLYANEQDAPKDVPCNDLIMLMMHGRELDMTVLCRSNDIIWGAYGANAVHFSILHEYLAARIGCSVGRLYQFSNNYHAYENTFNQCRSLIDFAADPYRASIPCPYGAKRVFTLPLVYDAVAFEEELKRVLDEDGYIMDSVKNPILKYASALKAAYFMQKSGDYEGALEMVHERAGPVTGTDGMKWDFQKATIEWIERKRAKKEAA